METIAPQWRALGGEILVVSFTPPAKMKYFLEKHPSPFRTVSDPERGAYRAFALGRTSVAGIFRPRVLWRYLKRIAQGWVPTKPVDDDLLQLGGDFLIDAAGRLVYAYVSRDATDRPTAQDLLAAIESRFGA